MTKTPITSPDFPELEFSVHNGIHSKDGIEVRVNIVRQAGSSEGWTLEVVNKNDGSTVWDETFPTDNAAYTEFLATLAKEGIAQFEFDDPQFH